MLKPTKLSDFDAPITTDFRLVEQLKAKLIDAEAFARACRGTIDEIEPAREKAQSQIEALEAQVETLQRRNQQLALELAAARKPRERHVSLSAPTQPGPGYRQFLDEA